MSRRAVVIAAFIAASARAQDVPDFTKDILPTLQAKCFECHRAPWKNARGEMEDPSAGLRLDGKAWILRGSDDGRVLEAGRPDRSPLYLRVALPKDDADLMPPKGESLTEAELVALEKWIAAGAAFGDWLGELAGGDARPVTTAPDAPPSSARLKLLADLAAGAAPASQVDLERLAAVGGRATPVHSDSPLLRVAFTAHQAEIGDKQAEALRPLQQQTVILDIARTKVGDATMLTVGKMRRLVRLDLTDVAITDRGLERLTELAELRSLVLCGVPITDKSIATLTKLGKLEALYVWRSGLTPEGIDRLKAALPKTRIVGEPSLPPPAGEPEGRRPRRSR